MVCLLVKAFPVELLWKLQTFGKVFHLFFNKTRSKKEGGREGKESQNEYQSKERFTPGKDEIASTHFNLFIRAA